MHYDVLIVGGSYAGLSAAMQLARARRKVCVVDAGAPRNRFSAHAHGFFGQDGAEPLAMIEQAREKLLAYPSVSFVRGSVVEVAADGEGGFSASLADGERIASRKLLLAVGVQDELPEIAGLKERWGMSVLHCPYCHGYEFADRRLGVLSRDEGSVHHAMLIAEWGPTTLFINGAHEVDDEARASLAARGVALEERRIAGLEGPAPGLEAVRLEDGSSIAIEALYVVPRTRMGSPLAEQLGCEFDTGFFGPVIRTDAMKMTAIPGVYAAGDAALIGQNATLACADGVLAGTAVHRALVFGT